MYRPPHPEITLDTMLWTSSSEHSGTLTCKADKASIKQKQNVKCIEPWRTYKSVHSINDWNYIKIFNYFVESDLMPTPIMIKITDTTTRNMAASVKKYWGLVKPHM